MPKLYYRYGAMGSSKSAQALMIKFNYEQKGFNVLLIKPSIDNRDVINDEVVVKSRIGIYSKCKTFNKETNLVDFANSLGYTNEKSIIICDEAQFCTKKQIDELHELSLKVPVLCFGLLTNFKTELFEGSKRLIEVAESISEIKSVCECGKKAIFNARFVDGKFTTSGQEIMIGADECYKGVCYSCYKKLQKN